jgi:hypothetical protein
MSYQSKSELSLNKKISNMEESTEPTLYGENAALVLDERMKRLTSKILKITLHIKHIHPELSKFIEEMPISTPDENNPEISLKNLKTYFDSLIAINNEYEKQHK